MTAPANNILPTEGFFVTIPKTLIVVDADRNTMRGTPHERDEGLGTEPHLNQPLASYMTELINKGLRVVVLTDGDAKEDAARLKAFGLDARALPVRRAEDFRGQQLEVLISDASPKFLSLETAKHIRPFEVPCDGWIKSNLFASRYMFPSFLEKKWGRPSTLPAADSTGPVLVNPPVVVIPAPKLPFQPVAPAASAGSADPQ